MNEQAKGRMLRGGESMYHASSIVMILGMSEKALLKKKLKLIADKIEIKE